MAIASRSAAVPTRPSGELDSACNAQCAARIVSAPTTSAPPSSIDAGSTTRWSCPASMRTRCGATNPTKPTAPPSVTAPAVAIAATRIRRRRVAATCTPCVYACRSPRSIRPSARASRRATDRAAPEFQATTTRDRDWWHPTDHRAAKTPSCAACRREPVTASGSASRRERGQHHAGEQYRARCRFAGGMIAR